MAVSEVDICNQALVLCGANTITSLSDESKEGKLCNLMYPKVRDQLISAHPWNFAMRRAELPNEASLPTNVWGWDYSFVIPNDVHRVLDVESNDLSWKKEDNKLFANHTPIKILFVAKIENPIYFPAYFDEALAYKLSATIVYALTQSATARDTLTKEANNVLRNSMSIDAQEGSIRQVEANDWLNGRR